MTPSPETAQERVHAFRLSGDPRDLWPDVPEHLRRAAHRQIFETTRSVLNDNAECRSLRAGTSAEAKALGITAFASGMGPLLGHWIETGTVSADTKVASLLAEHLDHGRRRATAMAHHCHHLLAACAERGVVPTILKGMYTARRFFPEPGVRPVADVDLLIAPDHQSVVQDVLRSLRYEPMGGFPHQTTWAPGGAPRVVRSLELDHVDNPWAVDLHTSVDRRFRGGFVAHLGDEPFTAVDTWELDGQPARVFQQPLLLTHLALHVSSNLTRLQLIHLVQLILVIRDGVRTGALQWSRLDRFVREKGIARFVYPALELSERFAPGVLDPPFRRGCRAGITRRQERILRHKMASAMLADARHSIDELLAWARGPKDTVRAALHYLRAKGKRRWARVYRRRLRLLLEGRLSLRAGSRKPGD